MANRTFGWIQNPSDFSKLKNVVALFCLTSDVYNGLVDGKLEALVEDKKLLDTMLKALKEGEVVDIKYSLLKGKAPKKGTPRSEAKCTGIVQAVLSNQKERAFSDDWTADGFLRWGISLGLLDYNIHTDTVSITRLGLSLVNTSTKKKEVEVLTTAVLSYPPVARVLNLLYSNNGQPMTKFEIGRCLGGLGEPGFTSIPQELYIQAVSSANGSKEKSTISANTEGTSDKYARMICNWLKKLGLVQSHSIKKTVTIGGKDYSSKMDCYLLTLEGIKQLKRVNGRSSLKRVPKIVYWHMLATKGSDKVYIRNRRAHIILLLMKGWKSLIEIQEGLNNEGLNETITTIADELKVIEAMGITVEQNAGGKYRTTDNIIKLEIPRQRKIASKTFILDLKDKLRDQLKFIDHRYLSLIDISFDNRANRDFEILTLELLTQELAFEGLHLGGSRKPDGIVSYLTKYGIIIDTKAYSKGYTIPISQADEMVRYIEENKARDINRNSNQWWLSFNQKISLFFYLFVSSCFKGSVDERLNNIFERTGIKGGGLDVSNLLLLADWLKENDSRYDKISSLFQNNIIQITDESIYTGNN